MVSECVLTNLRYVNDRRRRVLLRFIIASIAVFAVAFTATRELLESRLQATFFARLAGDASWQLAPGRNPELWLPHSGPYDIRLGYSRMSEILPRLEGEGFAVTAQTRQSAGFVALAERGFFPSYREKPQAGLLIEDHSGQPLYVAAYPRHQYADFETIPRLLVDALLYVENRDLLEDRRPTRNPAVDWPRLGRAVLGQTWRIVDSKAQRAGGSTLATQIEKFRHSPGGRTRDAGDKWRQMVSASLRAYQDGTDTSRARRRIVSDFLNSVPLGGVPGIGEVNGLGDGMMAWYGRDFTEFNRELDEKATDAAARALSFKQALSLIIAQRRPSALLGSDLSRLESATDRYLHLLARDGVIEGRLRDEALAARLQLETAKAAPRRIAYAERKAVNDARVVLGDLFGVTDQYALDRFDVAARSTIDGPAQAAVSAYLARLADRDYLRCAGFLADHLLGRGDPAAVRYSVTVYESGALGNLLRVQADNLDQPLDLNSGTRLDLGSSAKLRTLVSYFEAIAELHARFAPLSAADLKRLPAHGDDRLTRWAIDYLSAREANGRELAPMLEAALLRRYSASPHEVFFTGGGAHRFANFKREDDRKNPTVIEALEQSINLVFVRLMRDLVHYHAYEAADAPAKTLRAGDPAARQKFLERFAVREGETYLARFWRKYRDLDAPARRQLLAATVGNAPRRLAAAYLSLGLAPDFEALAEFMRRPGVAGSDEAALRRNHAALAGKSYSLADWAYLARVHPLELWLVAYLERHPQATYDELLAASLVERRAAASWLFHSRFRQAQDLRLAIIVEVAAFERLTAGWRRLGYPFETLAPSLATSIGSSADRPAALAELVGILVNDGIRRPVVRIDQIRFAASTPFETQLSLSAPAATSEQVLPPEVAAVTRQALLRVVEHGTARRLRGAYHDAAGRPVAAGGKTGTGDHRYHVTDSAGNSVSSRVVNRAATFAFFLGERLFGVVSAYVPGEQAAAYDFTSALPVQILRELEPALRGLLDASAAEISARCPG